RHKIGTCAYLVKANHLQPDIDSGMTWLCRLNQQAFLPGLNLRESGCEILSCRLQAKVISRISAIHRDIQLSARVRVSAFMLVSETDQPRIAFILLSRRPAPSPGAGHLETGGLPLFIEIQQSALYDLQRPAWPKVVSNLVLRHSYLQESRHLIAQLTTDEMVQVPLLDPIIKSAPLNTIHSRTLQHTLNKLGCRGTILGEAFAHFHSFKASKYFDASLPGRGSESIRNSG
ncbi:hypothetical protein ACPF8X_39350, partial [Streptomyces sp. G35A]